MKAEGSGEEMAAEGVLLRLVRRYMELAEVCYRVSVSAHGERGRFRKGHRARHSHPALLKKVDLDEALVGVYRRFFDPRYRLTSTSTSKSRRHGSEALMSPKDASGRSASRSE